MALGAQLLQAKLPRPVRFAQRSAARAGGKPADPHAGILALQRTAGNRAVTEMLRSTGSGGRGAPTHAAVQRSFSIRPGDLRQHAKTFTVSTGTYAKIMQLLLGFQRETDPKRLLELADAVQGLSVKWLADHADGKTNREGHQRRLIEQLEAEAKREATKLRAEAIYMTSFASSVGPGQHEQQFQGPNKLYIAGYAETAADMKAGKSTSGTGGTDKTAQELAARYKLSAAEIAAIRTFTLPDYLYINPAVANSDSWLRDNLGGTKDSHYEQFKPRPMADGTLGPEFNALKLEGALHGGMLSQALSKLPPYQEVTYRGTREKPADFKTKYVEGKVLPPFATFSSASKVRSKAQEFADGKGGNFVPPPDKTVSVVFVVDMKNGRDISKLSSKGDEKEVMILPGATFAVDRVVPMAKGNVGTPAATAWYTVFIRQTR